MQKQIDPGITRDEALNMKKEYLEAENLQKHSLATEAIMTTHKTYIKYTHLK